MARMLTAPAVICAAFVAGCGSSETPVANQSADAVMTETTPAGVTRDVVTSEQPPVQPMAAMPVIQSQPGPDGSQVDLLKVAVTGDILTVTLRCSSSEKINSVSFRVSDISVIDDATSQRISVLKDNEGKWMASNVNGDNLGTSCETQPGVIWAKFPAPPPTSPTVSINLPEVGPFDGIPVTR